MIRERPRALVNDVHSANVRCFLLVIPLRGSCSRFLLEIPPLDDSSRRSVPRPWASAASRSCPTPPDVSLSTRPIRHTPVEGLQLSHGIPAPTGETQQYQRKYDSSRASPWRPMHARVESTCRGLSGRVASPPMGRPPDGSRLHGKHAAGPCVSGPLGTQAGSTPRRRSTSEHIRLAPCRETLAPGEGGTGRSIHRRRQPGHTARTGREIAGSKGVGSARLDTGEPG